MLVCVNGKVRRVLHAHVAWDFVQLVVMAIFLELCLVASLVLVFVDLWKLLLVARLQLLMLTFGWVILNGDTLGLLLLDPLIESV